MKKGQIIWGVLIASGIGAIVYFGFVKKYNGLTGLQKLIGKGKPTEDNFELVKKNLGAKENKEGVVVVSFNNKKNKAQFYTNNRVIIFDENDKRINAGNYSDGGKTITMDDGKVIQSETVWGNLLTIIK